jgi:transposase
MEEEHNRAAKKQMIALMQAGHSWQEASRMAGIPISRSAAYRLLQKVRIQGEAGLQDGRHGTPPNCANPCSNGSKTTATPLQAHRVISCSRPLPTASTPW